MEFHILREFKDRVGVVGEKRKFPTLFIVVLECVNISCINWLAWCGYGQAYKSQNLVGSFL
jgi:hypothetical protein